MQRKQKKNLIINKKNNPKHENVYFLFSLLVVRDCIMEKHKGVSY